MTSFSLVGLKFGVARWNKGYFILVIAKGTPSGVPFVFVRVLDSCDPNTKKYRMMKNN